MHSSDRPRDTHAGQVMIVAHRGASHDAPENTMAAFALAWRQAADAIEGDFQLTADGQIVCMHDHNATRTGGVDRRVAEMTLAEVRALDVGRWNGEAYAGERVPTLSDVLRSLPVGKRFLIEVKCGVEIVPELRRVLADVGDRLADLRIICFDADVIAAVKETIRGIKAYWLTHFTKDESGAFRPTADEVLAVLNRTGADGVDVQGNIEHVNDGFIRSIKDARYGVYVWTIDDPERARTFAARGVDSITTNRPAFIRDALVPSPGTPGEG